MRRAEKEITDTAAIGEIIERAEILHLAMLDEGAPYVIPLSFGWADGSLWFHCAPEGTKLECIRRDPRVGFSLECDVAPTGGPTACSRGVRGRSVVGRGRARIVTDEAERRRGLEAIVRHDGAADPVEIEAAAMARTCVVRIEVEELRGRRVGGL